MSEDAKEILGSRYRGDRWAAAVGLRIEAVTGDRVQLRLPYKPDNMNLGGRLHGGVIATAVVDAAKLLGRWLVGEPGRQISPLDFQISYLRPGGRHAVVAEARLLRRTRTILFLDGRVRDPRGTLLASAALTLRIADRASAHPDEDYAGLEAVMQDLVVPSPGASHPLAELFNQRFRRAGQALRMGRLQRGLGYLDQEPEERIGDDTGAVAPGYQLLLLDRMGSVVSGTFALERSLSATVSLQASFCALPQAEALRVIGRTQGRYGELSHNQVAMFGRESGRLLVSGQVTHLLRTAKPSRTARASR